MYKAPLSLFKTTLITAMVVFLTSDLMSHFDAGDITVGNYLWLPMGAKILAFLLFGYWAFPGVLIGSLMSGIFLYDSWNGNTFYGPMGTLAGVLAPMLAIAIMKSFHLSNFFKDGKLVYGHIIFLVILSSLINTLTKLFLYINKVEGVDGKEVDALQFIQSYLVGDVLGGLLFVFVIIKLFMPTIVRNKLD